jgi:hypothetical protein
MGQNRERVIDKSCRYSTMASSSHAHFMHPRDHGVGNCVDFFHVFMVINRHMSTGLGNAAGEHGWCQRCGRTPHSRDCESESRGGAVVEPGYFRRLYDKSNSQRPYCTTLATLEGPTSFLCEKTAAQMNLCLRCRTRRWAAFSVVIFSSSGHRSANQ